MCRGHFLAACIGLFLNWLYHGVTVATEPGYLDFDNLPETNFSCDGKVIGGYYADTETGCQMFHVCTIGQKGEITDIKFLCLNGTVFDQETRVCERLDEVDCSKSESFYDLNLELYGNNGAGYGIQPENEESQDATLCEEEDEEDCKTEKPQGIAKTKPTEQVQSSSAESDEEEETTTQQNITPSTTSRRPVVTSTVFPSTTAAPQIVQFPSSSPEAVAALLALHKAFSQSLPTHSINKDSKINPPKLTGFVESLNPLKSTQEAETFEIKSLPTPSSSRLPAPFSPKPLTQYTIQQTPLKVQYQSAPKQQYQSPLAPKPLYQTPPKTQYQSQPKPQYNQNTPKPQYQSPPKVQYQNPPQPKPQYQTPIKSPPPLSLPPVAYPKPIQTTSERYGNAPFHHSFHISSQINHYRDQNYHDQYTDHESQPTSQPQTEAPKQYDFNDYDDYYYDEKPHSSTITPYLLHQIKVNQVRNANQAKAPSVTHGSFVREVSSPTQSKPFSIPSFRSVTTPDVAIITATRTTSSSSVKTSKPVQSAIQSQKETVSSVEFVNSLLQPSNTNVTHQFNHPQSYDDYKEGDVRSDPFYKDVPKIGRRKRSFQNDIFSVENEDTGDQSDLIRNKKRLKDTILKEIANNIFRTTIDQKCNYKTNSREHIKSSNCFPEELSSDIDDLFLGRHWKIVIPQDNSNNLYIIATKIPSSNHQNFTSDILLVFNFSKGLKTFKDNVSKSLQKETQSTDIFKHLVLSSVNSSIHHRFKRVKRNKLQQNPGKRRFYKNIERRNVPSKNLNYYHKREKRQVLSRFSENIDDNEKVSQQVRFQGRQRSQRRGNLNTSTPQLQTTDNQRLNKKSSTEGTEYSRPQIRARERRPLRRRPSIPYESARLKETTTNQDQVPTTVPDFIERSEPVHMQQKVITEQSKSFFTTGPSRISDEDKNLQERPTARRRGQGVKYHFSENIPRERIFQEKQVNATDEENVEAATTYPFNLKPGTQFSCDNKIKGGYYADVEAECYGYFICSQGEINGPLLKSHFWCGPTTKFNQRSRTCQMEANVACTVSHRYFHLNKDILSLPDPEEDVKDSFEPSKV